LTALAGFWLTISNARLPITSNQLCHGHSKSSACHISVRRGACGGQLSKGRGVILDQLSKENLCDTQAGSEPRNEREIGLSSSPSNENKPSCGPRLPFGSMWSEWPTARVTRTGARVSAGGAHLFSGHRGCFGHLGREEACLGYRS
jgi:hypothetical protein